MSSAPTPELAGIADAAANESRPNFPVVGIGASAGAVGALSKFFQHLPDAPGMAFVVVIHLSPDHASMLDTIIGRATRMPVLQVRDETRIELDRVYVNAPGHQLEATDGMLRTLPRARGSSSVVIDLFLRSLGEVHRERAIGIVLTGMGSDGALGLRRIKECGGVTMAQAPAEAEFESMPVHAIGTGAVDFVLPAAAMGAKLEALWRNARRIELPTGGDATLRAVAPRTEAAATEAEVALSDIMGLLQRRTGHDFQHYKRATVLRRLERRLQVTGMPSLPAYARYLEAHPPEAPALLKDLLISVTNFFRDPEAFEALARELEAGLFGGPTPPDAVRAWVAGCATGEEAYSMAILLSELAERLSPPTQVQVFGSDIDERALALARTGLYPGTIVADVSAARIRRYFQREHSQLRVHRELRNRVLFAFHNLLRDPPFSRLDVVSCRNLLIYLERPVQAQVMELLHFALRPGGLLLLGKSESIELADGLFVPIDKRHRLYRAVVRPALARELPPWRLRAALPPAGRTLSAGSVQHEALHDLLRGARVPASALVDAEFDLLHATAGISPYLGEAGDWAGRDLFEQVRPELVPELRAALVEARARRTSVAARPVALPVHGEDARVLMNARFVAQAGRGYLVVDFDHVKVALAEPARPEVSADPQFAALQVELERTREELHGSQGDSAASTEELRASNEELQSINEELRSMTEELETSKEELQSVNEELVTVNQELKLSLEETRVVNDDLSNLIGSTDLATLFLDRAMHVKRFTPRTTELFNLIPSDIGRSLLDITHRLDYPELEDDAVRAFESLQPVQREVRGPGDSVWLARAVPYRTQRDLIDGAVMTFVDVSAVRQVEARMRTGEASLALLLETARDFAVVTLDPEGRIRTWNEGARRLFGHDERDAVGQPVDVLDTAEDRAAGASRAELAAARSQGRSDGERWQQRRDGEVFRCGITVAPLREGGTLVGYARIARDCTDSQRTRTRLADASAQEAELRAEARRASAMKEEFLAVMSHELKHPLNLIQVNAELLARLPEARDLPAVAHAAEVIRQAVLSQARITDDLLDLSRLRTGKLAVHAVPVAWGPVVSAVVDAVAADARAKGLALATELAPDVVVRADPVRLEQIVWNLVSNALKFSRPGGGIRLRLAPEGAAARLDVEDQGRGIAPDFLPHVFDMFRQAEPGTSRREGGLGIGLALVKLLAEQQGGRVAVASPGPGQGASFSVWLPLADAPVGASPAGPPQRALEGLRLLVVDDSADALQSFTALLRLEGATVTPAGDGPAALAALEVARFDALVSDVAMPGMDGYELIRRVRAHPHGAGLASIALTGFGRARDAERARAAGFDAHLPKPVVMERLLDAIEALLPGRTAGPRPPV